MRLKLQFAALAAATFQIVIPGPSSAEVGVTSTEIKVGTILPFSGPASSYGTIAKSSIAYVEKINAEGGINGRKISIISYDDAYSPPKTVEMARKLVEGDEVLILFNTFGTPTNMAILKYLNGRKVPDLFIGSGAAAFGDSKNHPWSMGLRPDYVSEGRIYGRYISENMPAAKIGVILQNDDFGRDLIKGLSDGLGEKISMIMSEQPYDVSSPTVDSQIVSLRSAGADTLMIFASNKFAAQTIRKVAEIGWKPTQFLASAASSVSSVIKPAGIDNAEGIITSTYLKDPVDPNWLNDNGVRRFQEFVGRYYSKGDLQDLDIVQGYNAGQLLELVLKNCGDDLSRANVMKQAESLKQVQLDMVLPGIYVDTSIDDHRPIEQMQLVEFKDGRWISKGGIVSGK
jgi:branched-chain amino acid transport system substrate-binding protein